MDTQITVALIAMVGTVLGSGITAISGLALIRHRLSNVEKKLDEHNGYAQMYASAHEDIALIKQDLSYLKEKVNDINERGKQNGRG